MRETQSLCRNNVCLFKNDVQSILSLIDVLDEKDEKLGFTTVQYEDCQDHGDVQNNDSFRNSICFRCLEHYFFNPVITTHAFVVSKMSCKKMGKLRKSINFENS